MRKQLRSTPVKIIITLALLLLGVAAFLLWQNFIQHNEGDETSDVQIATPDDRVVSDPKKVPVAIDEADYSLALVDGFNEVPNQLFEYTASLKAVKTFQNADGDYFEILVPYGGGGGVSSDYAWSYTVNGSRPLIEKSSRCTGSVIGCTATNGSVEGIIFSKDKTRDYYFAFGNKTKDKIDLVFVDTFISTFQFK